MNAITTTDPVSAQALEHILGTGDLSKLSTQQRVEFYAKTCQSLGLNPLTRPFRFMSFQGNTVMYATRDCTDQLRKVNGITLHVVDKQLDGELFIVTVRARDKLGREDEDMGAVTIAALKGESRANALMKALTKAKRRVTLSICGLGLTDEAELDTMPGAYTFDADAEPDASDAMNAAIPITKQVPLTKAAAPLARQERKAAVAHPLDEQDGTKWLANLESLVANAQSRDELEKISDHRSVGDAIAKAPGAVRARISELLAKTYGRLPDPDSSHEPDDSELEIVGAEKLGA
jgi:hypothetical protein